MKKFALALVLISGCQEPPPRVDLLTACFAEVAYDVYVAEKKAKEATPEEVQPTKCCGECKGTGKVLSGDRITRVPCGCPDTCECKKKK